MEWELVRPIPGLPVCSHVDLNMPPWSEEMIGLFPGYAQRGYPTGETPQVVQTFGRCFSELGLEYPKRGRAEGWSGWRPLVVTHDDPGVHRVRRSAAENLAASCHACRASRRA